MSWGIELWDKYEDLCGYTATGIDFLEKSVAEFVKERAKVEKEYAKSLRTLVKKYAPKGMPGKAAGSSDKSAMEAKDSGPASIVVSKAVASFEEEMTHMVAYKEMLQEVGFQAGQHEVLAEALSKEIYKNIHDSAKQLKEIRRKNMKESEKLLTDLNAAFKSMQASKEKFRKAFDEQEKATAAYKKADSDGNVSRNEMAKLQMQASSKTSTCEAMKHTFADQLVKTNAFRQRYYYELLPGVLSELQSVEHKRIELMRQGILSCLAKEVEVQPIISKCHESIQKAMDSIEPERDSAIVIERFKSGDVPPGDFNFEDMQDPHSLLNADALASTGPSNLNLYPRKRELERQMAAIEAELIKSQKELKSLSQMMATYQKQPKFGNTKQFKNEIQSLHSHVSELEAALTSIRAEHVSVEDRLETLARSRSPQVMSSSPMSVGVRLNRGGSTNSSGGSVKSSSLSIASSSRVYEVPSSLEKWEHGPHSDDYDVIPPPPPEAMASDTMSSMSSPSVTSSSSSEGGGLKRCVALYTYNHSNMEESNIPMEEGEELLVVDEDCDGWTRVRRLIHSHSEAGDEGFVPTAWIRMI